MLNDVEDAVIKVLRENLEGIPKENINVKRPDFKKDSLPSISFENVEFKTEDLGMGASSGEKKEGAHDKFSGDNKTEKFNLSKIPFSVKYFVDKSVGETKGFKFNLKYNLCIWAKDEGERDRITMDVLKTLLMVTDELNDQGIVLRTLGGANIGDEKIPEGVFGKNIECDIESEVYVEVPYERIRKIEVKKEIK
ncbi:MAG: hypothetical protein A7315_15510 [Candidatus Altiarchaeales archaeon WOR_SM1_79]|nr:MAG: hypothetical protein A7315_15510 [Candidatus Altiarchaeales archaeon WOR_SM1_79]